MKKLVTIGGGSGHSQVLQGLKTLPDIAITAICGSTDSGGSSGILRRDYRSPGYLGDLTKCIVALSEDHEIPKALLHRFENGCLHGHSVKNVLFLGLIRTYGQEEALMIMRRICGVNPAHSVIPVTTRRAELCVRLKAGTEIMGEANIDTIAKNPLWNLSLHAIEDTFLRPHVRASENAVRAISEADWCIVGPGDLYSSIIPALLPGGVREAFKRSSAKIVVVVNIMTKNGETDHYTAENFVERIESRIGRPCDTILFNATPIPRKAKLPYRLERKVQLTSSSSDGNVLSLRKDPRLVKAPLVMVTPKGRIQHDPMALANVFSELIGKREHTVMLRAA